MAIAFIIPTLEGGGAERVVSRLSLHFAESHRVAVITWDGRNPVYPVGGELIDLSLPARPTLIGKALQQQRRVHSLAATLERLNVDQAIGFMEAANVPLILARRRLRRPPHITVSIRVSPTAFGPLAKWNMRRLYPRADRIVVQTQSGMRACLSGWGFAAEKLRVIANPLPQTFLLPTVPHSTREPGLIVAIGRLTPQKSFHSLITAFSSIPKPTAARLVIVGEGPLREPLQRMIRELELSDRVQLMGSTSEVSSWLDRAALFVMSSTFEGFPNALAEAMARACPIVSTDCPTGPGEMLHHEQSGLLIPVDDVQALKSSIIRMLTDDRLANACGNQARSIAEQWAIERIAPAWLK